MAARSPFLVPNWLRRSTPWTGLIVSAALLGAVIARIPLLAFAVAGLTILFWLAWPAWMRTDVEYFAGLVFLFSALFGVPRLVQVGPFTLDASLSVFEVFVAMILLAGRSTNVDVALRRLWPLVAFVLYALFSFFRTAPSSSGVQNVLVYGGFVIITALVVTRTIDRGEVALRIERVFVRMYWVLAAFEGVSILLRGPGTGYLASAHGSSRSFGLIALLGVACGLMRWRYGDRRRGAAMAASAVVLIALSLSRGSLLVACLLIPFAGFDRRNLSSFVKQVALIVAAVAVAWACVTLIPPLHARFFPSKGDFVRVGHLDVNANGRRFLWSVAWHEFQRSPWIGNGAGASENTISQVSTLGHPHNDYLRLLDDFGVLGAAFWVLGIFLILSRLSKTWLAADAAGHPDARFMLWALLALIAVLAAMVTDNPLVYLHVQAPLAIIVGMALGRAEDVAHVAFAGRFGLAR